MWDFQPPLSYTTFRHSSAPAPPMTNSLSTSRGTIHYYPQSNGKLERYHRTMKHECIRPRSPVSLDDAKRIVGDFVGYYNNSRLHSALGSITPLDKLSGKEDQIFLSRNQKLEAARQKRKLARSQVAHSLIDSDNNILTTDTTLS
jgi:putative transposase